MHVPFGDPWVTMALCPSRFAVLIAAAREQGLVSLSLSVESDHYARGLYRQPRSGILTCDEYR